MKKLYSKLLTLVTIGFYSLSVWAQDAPVIQNYSDYTGDSFVANWDKVSGADKYFLNVYMQVPVDYDLGLLGNLGTLISIINIVQLALMIVVASFSDRLYYNHVVREIKKLRSAAPSTLSQDQYLTMLAFNGRTNPRMGYGMALLSAAVVFGISYLITYQILATTML